ncbi:MAG: hypothetical protein HY782_07795 [Chloroflexi bacterium]|nr:hypothetical protein [Chloroflexota bacterium]
MSKKKTLTGKNQIWIEAQKKYKLSDAHVRMAKELGMNPKKFGGLANARQEPWKAPLPQFIKELYSRGFGKTRPDEQKRNESVKPKEPRAKEAPMSQDV